MKLFLDLSIFRRNRNYTFLFIGQFVSFFGTMITGIALPYQIYHETQSTLMVGLLSLVQLIPLLVTALIGGVFADRYHRRFLLFFSEFFLAVGSLLLVWNATTQASQLWLLFIVASLMSAVNGLHRPALESLVQQIVPQKDFANASALSTFKFSAGMIAGPAVGGILISTWGLPLTYLIDTLSFIISLAALLMMSHIPKPVGATDESTFALLKTGFRYAFSRQELIGTYLVDFIAMIFAMPNALFPAIAQQFGGPNVLGLLYSAPAVGGLLVSLVSAWAAKIERYGAAVAISAIGWGFAIIGFGLATHLYTALFFLAIAGGFDAISGIFRMMMWNLTIPKQLRGRLAGIEMIGYLSGPKLGDTEAGLVAAMFGITFSVVSGGIMCILGIFICCFFLPKFWHYKADVES